MLNGAAPDFALEGGIAIVLLRAVSVGALMWTFGAGLFGVLIAPRATRAMAPAVAEQTNRRLRRLFQVGGAVAIAALAAWSCRQTVLFADTLTALPAVVLHTRFGQVILIQLVASAASLPLSRYPALATVSAGTALAFEAGHSHAFAMADRALLFSNIAHLLAAGAWLGGLPSLLLVIRSAPASPAAVAARDFSPLGITCVAILAGTALFQGIELVGSWAGLAGTAYGWAVVGKIAVFAVLIGFAALNRFRLVPALAERAAKRPLVLSVAAEAGAGALIVALASLLGSFPPGMHTQPVWPFTVMPSLAALREVPEFRQEMTDALLALLGALALIVLAIWGRRLMRWLAVVCAAVLLWYAVPHLGLLFVPAHPTSFETSETGFAAAAIARGKALFAANCSGCHGADGRGDGPAEAELPAPPADLAADHLWEHSDGEMAWWLEHGIDGPDGALLMPSFADALTPEERWSLIDFVRANNAGLNRRASGAWPRPVQAPGFDMRCAGGTLSLDVFRGMTVLLLIGNAALAKLPPGVMPIRAASGAAPAPGFCATDDTAVETAFRIVTGIPAPEPGAVLIDPAGWLRAASPGGWPDAASLAKAVAAIRSGTAAVSPDGGHHHHGM